MLKYWNTRPGEPPTYDACYCELVMAVASTALSAVGALAQGQASAGQATYQAQVARNNQVIAQRNALDALKRGDIEEDHARQRTAAILGQQRARLAGQGSTLDDGSPLDIQMDTAGLGELDALALRTDYQREAYAHELRGINEAAQASLYDSRSSTLGSLLSGGGSLLGGLAAKSAAYRRGRIG